LIPPLQSLGMKDAFISGEADFSGMFRPFPESGSLYINIIKHQAVLEVNEKGTEAAAVTALGVSTASASVPFDFRADRPFFYAVEDAAAGIWLFLGSVADPLADS
jgi:serine protease inhibitor